MTDISFLSVLIVYHQCDPGQLKRSIFLIAFVRKHYDSSSSFTLRDVKAHAKEIRQGCCYNFVNFLIIF